MGNDSGSSGGYAYLATPYSHPDPAVRQRRFEQACQVAARLMAEGEIPYSPVIHNHPVQSNHDLPQDHEFWMRQCLPMLETASKLVVVMLPGWKQSRGIEAEIRRAEELRKPIAYLPMWAVWGDESAPQTFEEMAAIAKNGVQR